MKKKKKKSELKVRISEIADTDLEHENWFYVEVKY